jgi:hypothetical protein
MHVFPEGTEDMHVSMAETLCQLLIYDACLGVFVY